jgi:16S rRNA pseudouridine516 synthase
MRLDKYLSSATDLSRTDVKYLIRNKHVLIDGEICKSISFHVSDDQTVELDGEVIEQPGPRYFMLHKPKGYVCATKDSEHPTVIDLLDEPNKEKLQVAGRLDIDTTGLVLITDDGQWNHAITSPKRDCKKQYHVTLISNIDEQTVADFEEGIQLRGEERKTLPATMEMLYKNEVLLTISEGKYHQVKRMFAAAGNKVSDLHRKSIGAIDLDPDLNEGEYRRLTATEAQSISEKP